MMFARAADVQLLPNTRAEEKHNILLSAYSRLWKSERRMTSGALLMSITSPTVSESDSSHAASSTMGTLSPGELSVIIPSLNEEAHIESAIQSVNIPGVEVQPQIIVVDAGSADETCSIATRQPGVKVLQVAGGRGAQLNEGALHAKREWLLFLHADCQLPSGYFASMTEALNTSTVDSGAASHQGAQGKPAWGCFSTIETGHPRMGMIRELVRFRTKWQSRPYGDQGLFVKSSVFSEGAQFKQWPFLEDLEWVSRMKQLHGRPAIVQKPLMASSRRWQHYGVIQTTLLNQLVLIGYALGVPIHTLHWFYNSARGRYTSQK